MPAHGAVVVAKLAADANDGIVRIVAPYRDPRTLVENIPNVVGLGCAELALCLQDDELLFQLSHPLLLNLKNPLLHESAAPLRLLAVVVPPVEIIVEGSYGQDHGSGRA